MSVLSKVDPQYPGLERPDKYVFFCPGCNCGHWFDTKTWTWNGSMEKPTISPSILVHSNDGYKEGRVGSPTICHSFVKEGKIQFLNDSTHSLSGQTVDLPDMKSIGVE